MYWYCYSAGIIINEGVHEVHGDLLTSDCDLVIHCCNCFHTMGAGIAKSIK